MKLFQKLFFLILVSSLLGGLLFKKSHAIEAEASAKAEALTWAAYYRKDLPSVTQT